MLGFSGCVVAEHVQLGVQRHLRLPGYCTKNLARVVLNVEVAKRY